jgi:hypothetical protein
MPGQPTATRTAASAAAPDKKSPTKQSDDKRSWLGNAMRALFVRDVRVRRVDGKLAVALENQPDQPADGAGASAASPMRAELKALLNAKPDSRSRLRFLAAVEHGLKHKDPTGLFLFEAEPERLRTALRQLDGLAPAKPSEALAALRARIVDAIGSRERKQKRLEMSAPRSDLMRDNRVEVAEGRASDFARIHEQWKAKSPAS